MLSSQVFGCVCSVLVVASVWGAPVSTQLNAAMKKRSANSPVLDQETQLKSLLSMAGKHINIPDMTIQKSHVSHVESTNGKEVKHEAVEEKVLNSKTGEVVSDIKQDVSQGDGPESAVVETKVDIPAQGIHKTIINNNNQIPQAQEENIELTSTDLAQYLLETGKFQTFYSAIQDLVNSNIMTQEEAETYQQEVMAEYQRLLAEIDAYQAEIESQESLPPFYPPPYPGQLPQQKRAQQPYDYQGAYIPADLGLDGTLQDALINNQNSLNSAIDALLEAWWNQAFQAGDARAQALVEYLYNIVSKDDDADDIGQIREILAEMLTRALMDDLTGEASIQPEIETEESEEEETPEASEESQDGDDETNYSNDSTEEEADVSSEETEESTAEKASDNSSSESTNESEVSSQEKIAEPLEDKTAKM